MTMSDRGYDMDQRLLLATAWITYGISVLDIEDGQIAGIDALLDPALVPRFGPAAGR
jgi:hypothetical protein